MKDNITIQSIGARGDGVTAEDGTIYIAPKTNVGDVLALKDYKKDKNRCHITKAKTKKKGTDHKTPPCPHFGTIDEMGCGGCSLQHLTDEAYTEWLKNRLRFSLKKLKITPPQEIPVHTIPSETRRRIAWQVHKNKDGDMELGYFKPHSHTIVPITSCTILHPDILEKADSIKTLLSPVMTNGQTIKCHISLVDDRFDAQLDWDRELSLDDERYLAEKGVNIFHRLSIKRKSGLEDILYGRSAIHKSFGAVTVPLPPNIFLQATQESEDIMVDFVCQAINDLKSKSVCDLFCGIGTFMVNIKQNCKRVKRVEGYDNNQPAIDILNQEQSKTGVYPFYQDLHQQPLSSFDMQSKGFDTVVIDPPRKGAYDQCVQIARAKPDHVIAISCHPDSFAKDISILLRSGYSIKKLEIVDQFLWSHHLEVMAVLSRT